MPARRKNELVQCAYFTWILYARNGVYYASGRSHGAGQGRHSLGSRDRGEALRNLHALDKVRAVAAKLAGPEILAPAPAARVALDRGRDEYLAYVGRPRVVGGAKPQSVTRYRPVFKKFLAFAAARGVQWWDQVTTGVLEAYAAWLEGQSFAADTLALELTTLKQLMKWLVADGRLPADHKCRLRVAKPRGTTRWCWRPEEVAAMVGHCRAAAGLAWVGDALVALACTGLRISELAGLRWGDVDRARNVISLTDESRRARPAGGRARRETKSGRDRSFPIHADLKAVLDRTPKAPGDDLVFHGPRGGRLKPDTLRTVLARDVLAPLAPKFPHPDGEPGFRAGRLHSFRHYFCSTCASAGVAERVIMAWLGHADSAMVSHYYHLQDAESQRQMANMRFVGGE